MSGRMLRGLTAATRILERRGRACLSKCQIGLRENPSFASPRGSRRKYAILARPPENNLEAGRGFPLTFWRRSRGMLPVNPGSESARAGFSLHSDIRLLRAETLRTDGKRAAEARPRAVSSLVPDVFADVARPSCGEKKCFLLRSGNRSLAKGTRFGLKTPKTAP